MAGFFSSHKFFKIICTGQNLSLNIPLSTGAGNGLASDPGYSKEFHVLKQKDFKAKDKKLKKIFDKSKSGSASYRIATNIVDGIYTGCPVCSGGISHGGSVPAG